MATFKEEYYEMPLRLGAVIQGKHLPHVDIKKAIHQNIRLIIKSVSLSYRFDPTFGSLLNKFHAATPPQKRVERTWREEIREKIQNNLKDMFQRYETRLDITDVMVGMKEPVLTETSPTVKVAVEVFGNLNLGRKERFHYPDSEIEEDAQEAFPLVIPVGR